jgi:hypothetical protein
MRCDRISQLPQSRVVGAIEENGIGTPGAENVCETRELQSC